MLDFKVIEAIGQIIQRGHDAKVTTSKQGVAVYEVQLNRIV